MKTSQNENVQTRTNALSGGETETAGASMAPPSFSLTATNVNAAPVQMQTTDDTEPGEAITDSATYYVSVDDATIRNDSDPSSFTGNEIPQGTRVKRTRTYSNGAVAQVEVLEAASGASTAVGTKYWTTFTNIAAVETVTDAGNHYVSYSDTLRYSSPFGAVITNDANENQSLGASHDTAYTISERCGAFVKVQQGGTEMGWVMEGAVMDQETRDRAKYMADLKTWLESRYTEVEALEGDDQKTRIKGILSLMEDVAHQIEGGTFPTISELSTTPTFTEHDYTSFIPPELTATVRQFIEILETGEPDADAETTTGDDYDWNARLGVPQYRTQSDNLAPPEATCGPTSFSMGAERLGYSRADVIAAIDDKLRESLAEDATQADVEDKFEEKAEDFLESFSDATYNYQKLRGNQGGLSNDEDDLAEGFREWGQYEDLAYFLAWLNDIGRGSVASPSSQTMLDAIHDGSTGTDNGAGDNSELQDFGANTEFTYEHRQKIQDTLAAGGAVIISLYHKGTQGGTHITTVREVTPEGLAMDDPYGQINPGYRHGTAGDAFKDVGGSGSRSSYDWRNVPDYDASEDDYAERDFTREAAEELETNESRGENEVLTWAMIAESTHLINYIRYYTRRD